MIFRSFILTLWFGSCLGLSTISELESFFDTVTDFEEFNRNIASNSPNKENFDLEENFKLLIKWIKLSRDEQLELIKNKTEKIAERAQESVNGTYGNEDIPIWPSCCGLNSETKGVFSPSLNVNKTMWPGCYKPMNPTTQTTPIFSLYEIDCLCTTYSNSTKPGDKMFSYQTAQAMKDATEPTVDGEERNQTNFQGLDFFDLQPLTSRAPASPTGNFSYIFDFCRNFGLLFKI